MYLLPCPRSLSSLHSHFLSLTPSLSFLTVTPLSRPLTIFSVIAHEIVTRMTGTLAILTPLCLGLDLDLFAYLLHLLSTIYSLDN